MGQWLAASAICAAVVTPSVWAADVKALPPTNRVLEEFKAHTHKTIEAFLSELRPAPLDPAATTRVIASLPLEGNLSPSHAETERLTAVKLILEHSGRAGVMCVRLVDLKFAFVGLYYRAVVLVSRRTWSLVDAEEFAALMAHEVGHDYHWEDYLTAARCHDHASARDLELRADAVAVLTLVRLGVDPERLVSAVQKMTRYNEGHDAMGSAANYVCLGERVAFIRAMAGLSWADRPAIASFETAAAPPGSLWCESPESTLHSDRQRTWVPRQGIQPAREP